MPTHRHVEENGSAAMLAAKRSAGVVPEVNLRVSVTRTPPPNVNKATSLALKHRGYVTRSQTQGYQWPHKKDLYPPCINKTMNQKLLTCRIFLIFRHRPDPRPLHMFQ